MKDQLLRKQGDLDRFVKLIQQKYAVDAMRFLEQKARYSTPGKLSWEESGRLLSQESARQAFPSEGALEQVWYDMI